MNISLDMANLNMVNMSSVGFHIWQHLEKHQNETQLHHLGSISSVPVNQHYKHMINFIHPITPFTSPEESTGDTVSIQTLFSHTGSPCNSYHITYTSRIWDILLLFLLVLISQISVLTFTTRYLCNILLWMMM